MTVKEAKILVVDDDATLLDLLVDTLTTIGYPAVGAPGGAEALDLMSREKFDLVITDIKMPEMDGIALLHRIRRRYPDLPVLFITGVASDDLIGRASPDGFLAKPFRITHIEQMIENTLTGKADVVKKPIRKVMVVDDDDTFREMLADGLRYGEYHPLAVSTGEQALRELEQGDVDAVITDIKMPGMNGIELMKEIRSRYEDLPVILITAYFDSKDRATSSAVDQADAFLEKPFDFEAIIDILDRLKPVHSSS